MQVDDKSIIITAETLRLIGEIDEFKGSWKAFQNMSPESLAVLRKIATIESVGSSTRIEGAKLSDKEVEKLLLRVRKQSFKSRDEEEVAGYAEVMEQIFLNYQEIPLTENYVKQLHAMLLRHSSKDVRHRGEYKKFPNHVEAFDVSGKSLGIVFETTTPFATPQDMENLVLWTQERLLDKSLHPLIVIGIFVVCFLAIHPFQDGNGRLSRILTTLLLLKEGYKYVPFTSLESIIEINKESYYLALRRTQSTLKSKPDWLPWMLFFLRSLKTQKDNLLNKLEGEKFLTEAFNPLALQIIETTKNYGQVTITQLEKLTKANRNTLKQQLNQLVKKRQIILHGKGRGSWYSLI